ncbi:hypothetical protein [Clostridium saudiense]|jgi:hypothetical protein|uniref:hypothetical protein n=1 Tax=Clostridium saudiense TaxID=1414720 RepID=UPI0018DC7E2A|nr:hypothetical protein [Clostridium saudiense]
MLSLANKIICWFFFFLDGHTVSSIYDTSNFSVSKLEEYYENAIKITCSNT